MQPIALPEKARFWAIVAVHVPRVLPRRKRHCKCLPLLPIATSGHCTVLPTRRRFHRRPSPNGLNRAGILGSRLGAMTEQETNFRDLLQQIETALYDAADVDSAAFLQALQRAKPAFLNLLRYKARPVGAHATVQALNQPVG